MTNKIVDLKAAAGNGKDNDQKHKDKAVNKNNVSVADKKLQ